MLQHVLATIVASAAIATFFARGTVLTDGGLGPHSGLTSVDVRVAAGRVHTCAVYLGAVKCWGYNGFGQLGDGTFNDRFIPGDVIGLPGQPVDVTAGATHSCALTAAGAVFCWGRNLAGATPVRPRPYSPLNPVF